MEESSTGEVVETSSATATSSASGSRLSLMDLPAENLSNIISYIPRKSLFPSLLVSKQFHQLASAALYRHLNFSLAQSDIAISHRDPAYRLPDALHTFLTSNYDYAQHVKSFSLRMIDTDLEHVQKRIAAKFLAKEEAGMLLNTALLVMIRRAKGLETFNWQVPIECSNLMYQALSGIASLQTLHIHLDIQSVSKHHYSLPPPPPPPGAGFGGQTAVWWEPMSNSSLQSGMNSTSGSSKSSRSTTPAVKAQKRKLGAIKGLQNLTVTAIDDLATLDEIASCLQGSSKSLRTLTLSFAEALVSKSQKPSANNPHNHIPIQDDDVTTEPNSPDLNATGPAPTDLDLKREKQAQEQALARIFGLEKSSVAVQKQDKKVERSLKRAAKSVRTDKNKSLDKLATQMLDTLKSSNIDSKTKKSMQRLLSGIAHQHAGNASSSKNHNVSLFPNSKQKMPKFPPQSMDDYYVTDLDGTTFSYKSPKTDFEFTPSSSSNIAPPPAHSWDSSGMPIPLDPPKPSTGIFGNNNFGMSSPIPPMPAGYPLSSQSSYSYSHNPKPSSQPLHPVSELQLLSTLATPIQMEKFVNKWAYIVASWNPSSSTEIFADYEKILNILPPILSAKLDKAVAKKADILSQDPNIYQSSSNSSKKKKPIMPAPITPSESSSESSSSSDSGSDSESSTIQPSPKEVTVIEIPPVEDSGSDFDMEHPDVVDSEGDDNQDTENEPPTGMTSAERENTEDDVVVEGKGKGKAKAEADPVRNVLASIPNGVSHLDLTEQTEVDKQEDEPLKALTIDETIQEYIRMTHGLSIQSLTLSFIPLKSSVLAKALDLTALRRLVLHNVGAQGAFWTMVEKLIDQGVVFNLQSIYTDDVSPAFVSCLGRLQGLKTLHLLRRSSKEFSCTSRKPPASLSDIYLIGLKQHFETLVSLSVTNLEDDSWDFDDRLIRAISNKARKLKELAFAVDSNSFHTFLRCLPGLRNLYALHLINIKVSGAPSLMPHNEWKRLILDVLCYCPSLRLKYVGIALVTNGRVSQIGEKPKMSISNWYKKQDETTSGKHSSSKDKGKGKAITKDSTSILAKPINHEDSSDIDDERPNAQYSRTYRTSALADSYSIFSTLVLKGRL